MSEQKLTIIVGRGPVRRLQLQTSMNATIKKVWSALTDADEVQHWWTTATIEAQEGGRVVLDDGSELNGTVKVFSPPYIFEFTWNDVPQEAGHAEWLEHKTKSSIRFDLVEQGPDVTSVTLVQYSPAANATGAAAGWHHIVGERLRSYVETGSVPDDAGRFEALKKIYNV